METATRRNRGQFGIEFFLVVALVLLIASALLTTATVHLEQNDKLRDAVFARAAVEGVSDAITFVTWQGVGSSVSNEYYLPTPACVLVNQTTRTVECDVGLSERVKSHTFTVSSTAGITVTGCQSSGWMSVQTTNPNGSPSITCVPLS